MKIYCGKRDMFSVDMNTGAMTPVDSYIWLVKRGRNSWWGYDEEKKWDHLRTALMAQFYLLSVHNIKESSLLELLIRTGQTIDDIPMTKWDKVKSFVGRIYKWLRSKLK